MSYLYIVEDNVQIGIRDNYVVAKYGDGMLHKVPVETLESINIFGRSQISTQCIQECLKKGIPVCYYSKHGSYFGRLQSTGHIHVKRQRIQARLPDTELALELAKKIVNSKIHNQSVILLRYGKSKGVDVSDAYSQMKILMKKLPQCYSVSQIMGYEGSAARLYFQKLGKLVEPEFAFQGRSRRPPKDAFNSMLSLGYSLLMNEIYGKIENKGLNPYFGFFHQDKEKHPTLVSDLMEEWRAVIVDSLVMGLVNGHEILMDHFCQNMDEQGVFLTKEGMKIFLKKMENRMRRNQQYLKYVDYPVCFRRAMELQTESFAKAIEEDDAALYQPVWIR